MKRLVSKKLKPFAGVYAIINLVNGKMYVGSAVTGNLYMRFHKHLYGGSGSKIVAQAIQKYGVVDFAFVVLETIDVSVTE